MMFQKTVRIVAIDYGPALRPGADGDVSLQKAIGTWLSSQSWALWGWPGVCA